MRTFVDYAKRIAHDTRGATAIEYALIAGLVSVAFVSAATSLGPTLAGLYQAALDSFS